MNDCLYSEIDWYDSVDNAVLSIWNQHMFDLFDLNFSLNPFAWLFLFEFGFDCSNVRIILLVS